MFKDNVQAVVKISCGTKVFRVEGRQVFGFELDQQSWGFDGSVRFIVKKDDDDLLSWFDDDDLMTLDLTLTVVLGEDAKTKPTPFVDVSGLVTGRELRELATDDQANQGVSFREYWFSFADPAQVLLRQHCPALLYAEASLADAIKENLASGVKVDATMSAAKIDRPLLCVPGGSFYDYLCWFADSHGGYFVYDYAARTYELADSKAKPDSKTSISLDKHHVARFRHGFASPPRAEVRVHNSYALQPKTVSSSPTGSVKGVSRDRLMRSAIAGDIDSVMQREGARLPRRGRTMTLDFQRCPESAVEPGVGFTIDTDSFTSQRFGVRDKYRCRQMSLSATTDEPGARRYSPGPWASYELDIESVFETESEASAAMPEYTAPPFPMRAEGQIVCEIGGDEERPYAIATDNNTGLSSYQVRVPLWNAEITVLAQPQFISGHMYFPPYKNARILLDIDFDEADIVRYLDWGPGVQMPMDSQGNQILFGRGATSETSLKHSYVDGKSMLAVSRIEGADTELLTLQDGGLVLQVKEDSSKASASESVDLSADVAAASGELTAASKGAIGNVTQGFSDGQAELKEQMNSSVGKTEAALDDMSAAVSAKASEMKSKADASTAALAASAARLNAQSAALKGDLENEKNK